MFNEAYAGSLPIAASDAAQKWDALYLFEFWVSTFFFILTIGGMVYLVIRYKKSSNPRPSYITGSHLVEAAWTIIPTILLMIMFVWGYAVYSNLTEAPSDAYEVRVIGKQWLWNFYYPDGRNSTNELYVPVNKPVKLLMTSEDVLHSFFVPNLRVKQDVVPGMYTSIWFEATIPGKHQLFCTEYCGASHSLMIGKVIALEPQQWDAWQKGKKPTDIPDAGLSQVDSAARGIQVSATSPAPVQQAAGIMPAQLKQTHSTNLVQQGKMLVESKGCVSCHSADGSRKIGPSFKGAYGAHIELTDGKVITADDNYIMESIENPQAKLVKGYSPVMPTFKGMLTATETTAIISYIKSLK